MLDVNKTILMTGEGRNAFLRTNRRYRMTNYTRIDDIREESGITDTKTTTKESSKEARTLGN
jgi:hypothetical protein